MPSDVIVLIRSLQQTDLSAVSEIELSLFPDPWSLHSFQQFLNDPHYWCQVAFLHKKVVGYYVAQVVSEEAELHKIAVAVKEQGKGIGREMLKSFLNKAQENAVEEIFLVTRESANRAQKLYLAAGFKLKDRRKNYYQKPIEDALIYYKKLDTDHGAL